MASASQEEIFREAARRSSSAGGAGRSYPEFPKADEDLVVMVMKTLEDALNKAAAGEAKSPVEGGQGLSQPDSEPEVQAEDAGQNTDLVASSFDLFPAGRIGSIPMPSPEAIEEAWNRSRSTTQAKQMFSPGIGCTIKAGKLVERLQNLFDLSDSNDQPPSAVSFINAAFIALSVGFLSYAAIVRAEEALQSDTSLRPPKWSSCGQRAGEALKNGIPWPTDAAWPIAAALAARNRRGPVPETAGTDRLALGRNHFTPEKRRLVPEATAASNGEISDLKNEENTSGKEPRDAFDALGMPSREINPTAGSSLTSLAYTTTFESFNYVRVKQLLKSKKFSKAKQDLQILRDRSVLLGVIRDLQRKISVTGQCERAVASALELRLLFPVIDVVGEVFAKVVDLEHEPYVKYKDGDGKERGGKADATLSVGGFCLCTIEIKKDIVMNAVSELTEPKKAMAVNDYISFNGLTSGRMSVDYPMTPPSKNAHVVHNAELLAVEDNDKKCRCPYRQTVNYMKGHKAPFGAVVTERGAQFLWIEEENELKHLYITEVIHFNVHNGASERNASHNVRQFLSMILIIAHEKMLASSATTASAKSQKETGRAA